MKLFQRIKATECIIDLSNNYSFYLYFFSLDRKLFFKLAFEIYQIKNQK